MKPGRNTCARCGKLAAKGEVWCRRCEPAAMGELARFHHKVSGQWPPCWVCGKGKGYYEGKCGRCAGCGKHPGLNAAVEPASAEKAIRALGHLPGFYLLTRRQTQCAIERWRGQTTREIGAILGISSQSVQLNLNLAEKRCALVNPRLGHRQDVRGAFRQLRAQAIEGVCAAARGGKPWHQRPSGRSLREILLGQSVTIKPGLDAARAARRALTSEEISGVEDALKKCNLPSTWNIESPV